MKKLKEFFSKKETNETDPIVIGEPPASPSNLHEPSVDELIFELESETPSKGDEGPLQTKPLIISKEPEGRISGIRFGVSTDVGLVRQNNQDSCLALVMDMQATSGPPLIGFFAVADGMGGHHDGEIASKIAVQTLGKQVITEVFRSQIEGVKPGANQRSIPEILDEAMKFSNTAVQANVPDGGTTATCVLVRGSLAFFAHVGDSRAYVYSSDGLEVITRDHSLVRRLQELGQLTEEETEHHPRRNVLYRAIGQGDTLEIDIATRRLAPDTRILLCSDGLWGPVGDGRIKEILEEITDPQDACQKMIDEANAAGGIDNITAVIIQLAGEAEK